MFDIGSSQPVGFVRIYNGMLPATDEIATHDSRLGAHEIIVGDYSNDPLNPSHTRCPHTFTCSSMASNPAVTCTLADRAVDNPLNEGCVATGRYVYIYVPARTGNYLHFREVEVYAVNTAATIQTLADQANLPINTPTYTISVDVQCLASQAPSAGATRTVWSYGLHGTNTMNRLLVDNTHIIHDLGGDASSFALTSIYDLCDGEYHELMVTSSATERKIFMDGGLLATKATPGNQAGTDENFCLGGEDNSDATRVNRAWVGFLSDFKVYAYDYSATPECACHVQMGVMDYVNDHWVPTYDPVAYPALQGSTFTLRPTGCATSTGIKAVSTDAAFGDRGVIMHVTRNCPTAAPPPPPVNCVAMPYSDTSGARVFFQTAAEEYESPHTLWADHGNGIVYNWAPQSVSTWDVAYERCCQACQTKNANNEWLRPPQDGALATNRQCRQFMVKDDGSSLSFQCHFYDFSIVDAPTSYPHPVGGTYSETRLYSTVPFSVGAGLPNAPPSPAAPPPPFDGAVMTDLDCNALIHDSGAFGDKVRVCRYYYTPKCTGDNNPLCGGETNTDNSFCRNGNYDASIADNDPYNVNYCYKVPMVGYIPRDGNNRPAYLHHVGTAEDCSHFSVQKYLDGMFDRGYAPFCVHYPRTGLFEYNGGWFDQKAQWIYSSTNPLNAINVICSQHGIDCGLGIAAHGFSQGSHIASLSKKYEPRVTGILGFGAGCRSVIFINPWFAAQGLVYDHGASSSNRCMQGTAPASTHATQTAQSLYRDRSIYRVVSGINDEIFAHQQQMAAHTGYTECAMSTDCIKQDGSGFYLVRASENPQGDSAGHNFFRNGNALTTYFENGAYPWAMNPNLDWLARRSRGETMVGYVTTSPPPPSPPPDNTIAAEGQQCGVNQVHTKDCAAGTSCLVSDEYLNDNGETVSRSHCCRHNHWWWMCKYTSQVTGVVEHCRNDGQCDYGSGQCSGIGTLTNIKDGICSTSWQASHVDYDANNMYVVTDPTTFYLSDITGPQGWATSQAAATHVYMNWIAAQNANGNDLVFTDYHGGTMTLTVPTDPTTVTFQLTNDPNTQAGWINLAANYFYNNARDCLALDGAPNPEYYYSTWELAMAACAAVPYSCCTGILYHGNTHPTPWNPRRPALVGAQDSCSYFGGNKVTQSLPTTPCDLGASGDTSNADYVTYFRPPPVASWPRTGAVVAAAAASASYNPSPTPLPPAPPMRPPVPPLPPHSPPPPPVPSLPPPQPKHPPPPPPSPPPPQPSPPPPPNPPPANPKDPLVNADGTYTTTTATGPTSTNRLRRLRELVKLETGAGEDERVV